MKDKKRIKFYAFNIGKMQITRGNIIKLAGDLEMKSKDKPLLDAFKIVSDFIKQNELNIFKQVEKEHLLTEVVAEVEKMLEKEIQETESCPNIDVIDGVKWH